MVKKLTFLFDQPIGINFGPSCSSYFSLQNYSSQAKIGWDINKIPKPLLNVSLFLGQKKLFWGNFRTKNYTNSATIRAICLNKIEVWCLNCLLKKGLTISATDWEKWIFQRKVIRNYLHCITSHSKCDISTTVTPNWMRLEPMKARHPYLSWDTKFEEIRAQLLLVL